MSSALFAYMSGYLDKQATDMPDDLEDVDENAPEKPKRRSGGALRSGLGITALAGAGVVGGAALASPTGIYPKIRSSPELTKSLADEAFALKNWKNLRKDYFGGLPDSVTQSESRLPVFDGIKQDIMLFLNEDANADLPKTMHRLQQRALSRRLGGAGRGAAIAGAVLIAMTLATRNKGRD